MKAFQLLFLSLLISNTIYSQSLSVSITSSDVDNIICSGTSVTFTATASGTNNPYYHWKKNGNAISGANSSTYTTTTLVNNDVISVDLSTDFTGYVTSNLVLNLDAGLSSSYPGTGSVWTDVSGNGNNANLPGALVSAYSSSIGGGSFQFQHNSNYPIQSNAMNNWNLNSSNALSVETWIKQSYSGDYHFWFSTPDLYYRFGINPSGYLFWDMAHYVDRSTSNLVSANVWHNVVYTAAIESGYITTRVYIDGSFATSLNEGVTALSSFTNYLIGSGQDPNHHPMNAYMGLIRVYNRALSSSEVTQNYNALSARFDGVYAGKVSSNTITNSVYANNTITLSSDPATTSQNICYNSLITPITYSTTSATGADFSGLPTGVTGSWSDNAITISGTPTSAGSSDYTVTLTGGCGSSITASGSILVQSEFTAGSASSNQTILYDSVPAQLQSVAPSGGKTPYTYQWQYSLDNSNFTNISGANSASYSPSALTQTTYFRQIQTSSGGCGTLPTNTVIITVNNTEPIVLISNTGVCIGTTSVEIPVKVSNIFNVGVINLRLLYNPLKMTPNVSNPVTQQDEHLWQNFTINTTDFITDHEIRISGYGDGITLSNNTILFTLKFDIVDPGNWSGASYLTFNENNQGSWCEFAPDSPPNYTPFTDKPKDSYYITGGLIVNTLQPVNGNIRYYNLANTPVSGSDVDVKLYASEDVNHLLPLSSTIHTDEYGYYEFNGLCPDKNYDVVVSTTKATEGAVNTTDAGQVNYWSAGSYYSIQKVRYFAGDVTGAISEVNGTDALHIQLNFVNGGNFDKGNWVFWKEGETTTSNGVSSVPQSVYCKAGIGGTLNMWALCMGDFNRSYIPAAKFSSSPYLTLKSIGEIDVEPGTSFNLPLLTIAPIHVSALSLILNLPDDLLEIQDVMMNTKEGILSWTVKGNELRIGWNSINPLNLNTGDSIAILKVKMAKTAIPQDKIEINLANSVLNELADDSFQTIQDGIIGVNSVKVIHYGENSSSDFNIYILPNPFNSTTQLNYTLAEPASVQFIIYDLLGKEVKTLFNEYQQAGVYQYLIDANNLLPGIYAYKMLMNNSRGKEIKSGQLIITK